MCGVEVWRGGLGGTYRLPALSFAGASLAGGPAVGRGKAGRNLALALRFLHFLVEQHATEVSRLGSGVLYNTDHWRGSKFRAQSSG